MIKAPQLLADLTRLLKRLEEDLLRRIEEVDELIKSLKVTVFQEQDINWLDDYTQTPSFLPLPLPQMPLPLSLPQMPLPLTRPPTPPPCPCIKKYVAVSDR